MRIGIIGNARNGKDTVADIIIQTHPSHTKRSLAEPIKEACRIIYGWDDRHLYGELKDVIDPYYGFTPRHAMQMLGTEYGQRVGSDRLLWCRSLWSKHKENRNIIIPDIRFQHELDFFKLKKFKTVRIINPRIPVDCFHESERGVKDLICDYKITNEGTIEDLMAKVIVLIEVMHRDIIARRPRQMYEIK